MRQKSTFVVEDLGGPVRQIVVGGRVAQTLEELVRHGDRGITASTLGGAAVRISNYILALRRDHELEIETISEKHGGPFAGTHGRFRLRSNVTLPSSVVAAT